jgi:hypothetical protein
MSQRFCLYCQKFRLDVGFKFVVHPQTNRTRGMCPACQEVRKKPREELVALAKKQKEERKKK